MTYEELGFFTYEELSNLTYGEMSLPLNELLDKLVNENRPIPIKFYQKLCDLCDEINNGDVELKSTINISVNKTMIVTKPKNKALDFLEKIVLIYALVQGTEYIQNKFSEIWGWISSHL